MIIRPMNINDISELRAFYYRVRVEAFTWLNVSAYTLDDFDNDTKGEEIFVAEIDGQISGFISMYVPENFIHCLFIDSKYQRQGIGHALLEFAKGHLKRPMQLKCLSRNKKALAFYKKEGWKNIEEIIVDGPQNHYLLQYSKIK